MFLVALAIGCVEVKPYGPGPEPMGKPPVADSGDTGDTGPEVDWAELEEQLAELMEAETEADTLERLSAAHSLAGDMKRGGPHPATAVESYLTRLIEVESRATTTELPEGIGFTIGEGIVVEEIVEPLDIESARASLAAGDYADAVASLRSHRGEAEVDRLWQEAVDGFVHVERERAGALFVSARDMPEGEIRDSAVEEVVSILEGLLRDYPESSYVDAIERNLEMARSE
ncbi:MAG TPA: hypothetical protein QGF58_06700 [Myxococcota bacterium]|nr:hypothetical protein [Myxococcota bacterium]